MPKKLSAKQLRRLKNEYARHSEAEWLKIFGVDRKAFQKARKKLNLSPASFKPSASKKPVVTIPPFVVSRPLAALAVVISLLCLGIYLKCLVPLVGAGDAAEFTTAGNILGISHFPGYPLWVVLAKLFSRIPLGFVAFRLNFMAAFWGAASLFFVFLLQMELIHSTVGESRRINQTISVATTLMLAFVPAFIAVCLEADVYSLNLLFVAGLSWFVWHYRERFNPSRMFLLALLLGLGISNHYHIILVAPALIYLMYHANSSLFQARWLSLSCFFGLLGWGFYPMFIPLRAVKESWLNWSMADNFSNFISHITLSAWSETQAVGRTKGFSWLLSQSDFLRQIFVDQWGAALLILLLGVLFYYFKGKTHEQRFLLLFFFFTLFIPPYFLNYQVGARAVILGGKFYLPVYFLMLVATGVTLATLVQADLWSLKPQIKKSFIFVFLILMVVGEGAASFGREDRRDYFAPFDLGRNAINTLPLNSVLFSQGFHQTNSLLFFQAVLAEREDVTIIDRYGNVFSLAYSKSTTAMPLKAKRERQLIASFSRQGRAIFYSTLDYQNLRDLSFSPNGLLYLYQAEREASPWARYVLRGLRRIGPDNYLGSAIASEYLFHQGESRREAGQIETAAVFYQKAAAVAPQLEWVAKEGAQALVTAKREDLALPLYQRILQLNPSPPNYYLTGTALTLADRPTEAIPYLQRASSLDTEDPQYSYGLGIAHQRAGQANKAAQVLYQLIETNPGFLPAHFSLAEIYEKINPSQAKSYWQEYIKRARRVPGEEARIAQAQEQIRALSKR